MAALPRQHVLNERNYILAIPAGSAAFRRQRLTDRTQYNGHSDETLLIPELVEPEASSKIFKDGPSTFFILKLEHDMNYADPSAGSSQPAISSHDSTMPLPPFARAQYVCADGVAPTRLAYVSIRPTFEAGDHTVTATVDEAEECQIQFGESDKPSYAAAFYDRVGDAIDDALGLSARYPHLALWYNGQEVQTRFLDWRSLAVALSEVDQTWELVEEVAAGRMRPGDPEVARAKARNALIAIALKRVLP